MTAFLARLAPVLIFAGAFACSSTQTTARELRTYTATEAVLLDDEFSPALLERNPEAADTKRAARITRISQTVTVAKFSSVTARESNTEATLLQIWFEPESTALVGQTLSERIALPLSSRSRTSRELLSMPARWSGTRVVLFVSWYDNEDGHPTPHWHADVQSEATLAGVRDGQESGSKPSQGGD